MKRTLNVKAVYCDTYVQEITGDTMISLLCSNMSRHGFPEFKVNYWKDFRSITAALMLREELKRPPHNFEENLFRCMLIIHFCEVNNIEMVKIPKTKRIRK